MQASLRMIRQALSEGRIDHEADDAYTAIHQDDLPPRSSGRTHRSSSAAAARGCSLSRHRRRTSFGIDPRSLPGGGGDPADITGAAVDRKVGWIREAAGDRWTELEINVALWEVDPEFRRRSGPPPPRARGISEDELPRSPHYLVSDTEEMVETLIARREGWGISYVTLPASALQVLEPVIARLAT